MIGGARVGLHASRLLMAAAVVTLVLVGGSMVASETFSSIQVRLDGAPGQAMTRVSIVVDRYLSDEDARALQRTAARGGKSAMLDALRRRDNGSVSITGADPSVIYAAQSVPTDAGRRIVVVCSGTRLPAASPAAAATPERALRVIELQIDRLGNGAGQMTDAASIRIGALGLVEVDEYLADRKLLTEVKVER